MFDESLLVGEDMVVQPSRYENGENHSLHKIFSLLARGWSSKKIRKEYPDILPETITLARGVLVDRRSDFIIDTRVEKPFRDFKVLIDENISPAVSGYLRTHFKKVAHVGDVGLRGKCDERVWEYCINHSYDVIFTKDRANETENDLTFTAVKDARSIIRAVDRQQGVNITLSALPLLVHLPPVDDVESELKKLLRRNKDEFLHYLDNRATPYIDVSNGQIKCGPTYFELRGENHIEDYGLSKEEISRDKRDEKQRIKHEWLKRLSVEDIRRMTPERERKFDESVSIAVGMGGRRTSCAYLPN